MVPSKVIGFTLILIGCWWFRLYFLHLHFTHSICTCVSCIFVWVSLRSPCTFIMISSLNFSWKHVISALTVSLMPSFISCNIQCNFRLSLFHLFIHYHNVPSCIYWHANCYIHLLSFLRRPIYSGFFLENLLFRSAGRLLTPLVQNLFLNLHLFHNSQSQIPITIQ